MGERVYQNRGVCGQAFPSFPSPTPFLPPFCSRPIFRPSRMRKTNTRCPNFVRFVRERLLRRLGLGCISIVASYAKGLLAYDFYYSLFSVFSSLNFMYIKQARVFHHIYKHLHVCTDIYRSALCFQLDLLSVSEYVATHSLSQLSRSVSRILRLLIRPN